MAKRIDLQGKHFERLEVIEQAKRPDGLNNTYAYWLCKCDCGAVVVVNGKSLRKGWRKSCGCLKRENAKKMSMANVGRKKGKKDA